MLGGGCGEKWLQTDSQTDMPHNDPAQYTVLGWVKTATIYNDAFNLRFKLVSYFLFFPLYSTTFIALRSSEPPPQYT